MKPQFFDIEDLKTKPISFWSKLLLTEGRFLGNIYFVACGRRFRVRFECVMNFCYVAIFYDYASRHHFNLRVSTSLRELFDRVYEPLINNK